MRRPEDVALFRHVPDLARALPWVRLGDWPTPVERVPGVGSVPVFVKREDLSSTVYGGNKVRTLEAVLGRAVAAGATRIWATGAYGSNHAVATVLHAPTAGLAGGLAVFPQPRSATAVANLRAALSTRPAVELMSSPISLPFTMAALRQQPGAYVMAPGGATPEGTFGAMTAAFELAEQVERGECPAPARIVVAVGSTCTTAGLLVGLHLAGRLRVGFGAGRPLPRVTAVRVTPWPITSTTAIVLLAARAAHLLRTLLPSIGRVDITALASLLTVDRRDFGSGYGRPTARGYRAIHTFESAGGPPLDIVYSAKSAAALIELAREGAEGPLLFWATKSSAPLPTATQDDIDRAPAAMRAWLAEPR